MKINKIIKELRKKTNMTQEQLANILSISPQAVSRWENGSATPDISYLPLLANIFGVTTDYLLGMDYSTYDEKIDKIFYDALSKKEDSATIEALKNGIKIYPKAWKLKLELARVLFNTEDDFLTEEILSNLREMNDICDDIVAHCDIAEYRFLAIWYVCQVAKKTNNTAKARRYRDELPPPWINNMSMNLLLINEDDGFDHLSRHYIRVMCNLIGEELIKLAKGKDISDIETYYKKGTTIKNVLDTYDFDLLGDCQEDDWMDVFIAAGEYERAYECLCKTFEYLKDLVAHPQKLMFGEEDDWLSLNLIGDRTNMLYYHVLETFPDEYKKRADFIDIIRQIEDFFKRNWPNDVLG